MITDARQISEGTCINTDLCVIGGGVAAIATALEYLKGNGRVVIIPGGGPGQTPFCIDLYRGAVSPPGSHEPLEENRLRMWGGTTTVWGGRCIPFDQIDFEKRDWVPDSGWPIDQDAIKPYLQKASTFCEAGTADFDARTAFPQRQAELIKGFDNEDIVSWPLERWSVPTDFSRRYAKELQASQNLRVLLHAHAVHLQMAADGSKLSSVVAACRPGQVFTVRAKDVVLACGALENARLLLASNDVLRNGIGNKHDLVGRFYQSHRFGVCGTVELKDPSRNFIYDFERDAEGVYCRRRFWLTPDAQRSNRTGNAIAFFFRNVSGSSEHRNAMVSVVLLAKTLLGGAKKGPKRLVEILRSQRRDLLDHVWIILKDGPAIFGQLATVAYTRFFQKRRLPMVLPPKKANRFGLFFQTEHAPLRDSRVTLDEKEQDDFGVPRLKVAVKFSDIDYRTVTTMIETFKNRLESSGLGTLHLSEQDRSFLATPERQAFNSNAHHIGTTRMSDDPAEGVVDRDCRVHGIDNLYVAGSSVFPTSSHANPVLMIACLALRLGSHLAGKQLSSTR